MCVALALVWAVALSPLNAAETKFRRGDANEDNAVDLSDAVLTLNVLFAGVARKTCNDAMDMNDDGVLDISDGVFLLLFLFGGGQPMPAPYPDCGIDETTSTPDRLDCVAYRHCCFRQSDLDRLIDEKVEPVVCIPAGSVQSTVAGLDIDVCPLDGSQPCGTDGAVGCEIVFTEVQGTLDVPGKTVLIHIEGTVTDLPIVVTGLGTTTCSVDVVFAGDAILAFTTQTNPNGTQTVLSLGDPVIENPDVTLDATGGFLCSLLEASQDAFAEQLVTQLQANANDLVADLRPEIEGEILCAD
jgi:hypothetical protein